MHMQRKAILGAIIIVVVLLAAGYVVWKLQTNSSTPAPVVTSDSGWQVYKDNENGLSFDYPQAFAVDKQDNNGYSIIHVTDPETHAVYVSIMVVENPSQADTDEIFSGLYPKEIPPTSNSSTTTIEQRTLNGLRGVEAYGYKSEGHSYNDVFMYKNNHLWEVYLNPVLEGRITSYPEPGTPTPNKDTYEQILASIQIPT